MSNRVDPQGTKPRANATPVLPAYFDELVTAVNNIGNDARWSSGTGSPEGVVTGNKGDLYSRTDGGAATCLYVKESTGGNTGWKAVTTS